MNQLKELVRNFPTLPYLFIGSGISRRYLNVDDWETLLQHFVKLISDDELAYANYKRLANRKLKEAYAPFNSEKFLLPMVATLIEQDFNDLWFTSPNFQENRKAFAALVKMDISPFKIEVAEYIKLKANMTNFVQSYGKEIEDFKKAANRSFNGIITTNYDEFLETIFNDEDYNVFIGQESLFFSAMDGVRDIFKIHGCCSNPSSIVITYDDYVDFQRRNTYLAAKLMTIFVEHPIIFIGYSIGDPNVIGILESIVDCLSDQHISQLNNRLIFIERSTTPGHFNISNYSRQFGKRSIIIKRIELYDYSEFYNALLLIKAKYNPKLLNMIKKDIYDIVVSNKASGKLIAVADINDKDLKNVDVVVGVGIKTLASKGVTGIFANDIFMDIVLNTFDFYAYPDLLQKFVQVTLPKELGTTNGSLPIYKYIENYPSDQLPERVKNYKLNHYDDFICSSFLSARKSRGNRYNCFDDVINQNPTLEKQLLELAILSEEKMDLVKLEQFLINVLTEYPDYLTRPNSSNLKRLIKIYDWLKYKKNKLT